MGHEGVALAVGDAVSQLPEFVASSHNFILLKELAAHRKYGNELYAVQLALELGVNSPELEAYLNEQEFTHVQEGIELQQRDSTDFQWVGGKAIDPHTNRPMVEVAENGHQAQKEAYINGDGFDFMVARTEIDIAIAKDNDERMATKPIGHTWLRITPYAEEELSEDASNAGFWPKLRRAYVWVYRKKDDTTLEANILSIDRSDVVAFAGLVNEFGIELPADITSHELPGHVIEVPGLISNEAEKDELLHAIEKQYRELAQVVEAPGLDMTSREFIEMFAQGEIYTLKRLQKEIIYSLQTGQLAPYVKAAGITTLETLGHEYLTSAEIGQIMLVVNTNKPVNHLDGLELIMKAQRYGAWARIGEKLKGMNDSSFDASVNARVTNRPYGYEAEELYRHQQEYQLGQQIEAIDQRQLSNNGNASMRAAERGEIKPGCPGGRSFLSQTEAEAKESIFGGKEMDPKRWMSCPFCKKEKAVKARVCDKNLKCRHCTAEVRRGKVVNKGNGGNELPREVEEVDGSNVVDFERKRREKLEATAQQERLVSEQEKIIAQGEAA